MTKQPDEQNSKRPHTVSYDFQKMEQIVDALNFMRSEANKTGSEEIVTIIDSCFNMVLNTYYLVLRNSPPDMMDKAGAEIH